MAAFPTTRWTLIRRAATPTDESRQALESLCEQYAAPVLGFVRHRVSSPEKAEDIAQGFFIQVIERDLLNRADEDRGRFRTFLLHALRDYMADVHDFDNAQKRGGGKQIVSLDAVGKVEPRHGLTPDREFELQWVTTLLTHAMARLEREYRDSQNLELYNALRVSLDTDSKLAVSDVAATLRMSETAVRVACHRMRKRLGQIIRLEIAETVPNSADVDDELKRLMQIVEHRT